MEDSLKVTQNKDGSFTFDWNEKDPKWSWMNDLTSDQLKIIVEQAIQDLTNDN